LGSDSSLTPIASFERIEEQHFTAEDAKGRRWTVSAAIQPNRLDRRRAELRLEKQKQTGLAGLTGWTAVRRQSRQHPSADGINPLDPPHPVV
jgi:hypothetical protein